MKILHSKISARTARGDLLPALEQRETLFKKFVESTDASLARQRAWKEGGGLGLG